MPSLESNSGLRHAARQPVDLRPKPCEHRGVQKALVLERLFVLACGFLLVQLLTSGWLNVKNWPRGLAGLPGFTAMLALLLARFDVALVRLFWPRKRDEAEAPSLPWWLSQAITVAIVLLAAGFGLVLFGLLGLSFSSIATAAANMPSWFWIVANVVLLALALVWRAASRR
jgi:hypothetical protein